MMISGQSALSFIGDARIREGRKPLPHREVKAQPIR
jgi:hypothetical protein